MIYYLVAWLAFQCPGGAFKGLIPTNMKPLMCEQVPASALYAAELDAMAELRKHGASASIQICRETKGLMRCEPMVIIWEPVLQEKP